MPKFNEPAEFARGLKGTLIFRNWESASIVASQGQCLCYQAAAETWFAFGNTGSVTTSKYRAVGDWVGTGAFITNYNPLCALPNVHLADGATHLRIGGAPTSASTNKIRLSTDLGVSWSSISIGSSDTNGVQSMAWDPDVGYLASIGADIYKSSTGASGTYLLTQSTGATIGRRAINIQPANEGATSSPLVTVCNGTATYYTATTGSFTARTFPTSVKSIEWCRDLGLFIGLATNGTIYSSETGTGSWTVVYNPGSETFSTLAMFGPNYIVYTSLANILYSSNGTTWHRLFSTKTPVYSPIDIRAAYQAGASTPQQLGICGDTSGTANPTHFISFCG